MEIVYAPPDEHLDHDGEGFELAERWLRSQRVSASDVVVVVPVVDSIGRAPALTQLASRYRTETHRTLLNAAPPNGVVVAVWPREETLSRIEQGRPRAICVIQWDEEHTNDWLAGRAARDLSGRGPVLDEPTLADPIVRVALEDLAMSVNLGTGFVQYEDHDAAVLTLRLLRDRGHRLEAEALYRWAIAARWPADTAAKLRTITTEVLDGRRHQIHSLRRYDDDVYRHWEGKAQTGNAPR